MDAMELLEVTKEDTSEITDEDKKRINEARRLYRQKKYLEAMETMVEFADRDADCSYKIGSMYEYGYGVSRNHEKAGYWYEVAAALGHSMAAQKIGLNNDCDKDIEGVDKKNEVRLFYKAFNNNHSMIDSSINELSRDSEKYSFEIDYDRNLIIVTASSKTLKSAVVYIWFVSETETYLGIRQAFIRIYNMIYFPENKKNQMYKLCNDVNSKFSGIGFFVDERDNSITANTRVCFNEEICGASCRMGIDSLLEAADIVQPMFIEEIGL